MTGGNPQGLARAERQLGLNSWAVAFSQTHFAYTSDEILWKENDSYLLREVRRWKLLRRAIHRFDVIHFNFGSSILPSRILSNSYKDDPKRVWLRRVYNIYARLFELRDLPLLKKGGKGIVVTYQGDDARQGDYCRKNFPITFANEVGPEYYSPEKDFHTRWKIKTFARYADRMYALNPDLLHVLPPQVQFLPYAQVDLQDWQPKLDVPPQSSPPLVIHAPSHQSAKGTKYVLEAVSRLRAENIPFHFRLVEALSNAEARQIYEQADLLIDQVLAGWYGGISVELMALGKPVICYLRESDLKFIPEKMAREIPIINVMPGTLYQVLKEYLTTRRIELPHIGRKGRAYVENWHNPLKIAARLKRDYELILSDKSGPRSQTGGKGKGKLSP
jgi:glycosyltransferase involved in cell wall biosynthesis